MSLLLQALQRAARSREVTGQEPDVSGDPRLELEPQTPAVSVGPSVQSGIDLDDVAPVTPPRRTVAAAAPSPYALAEDYGGPTPLDYIRERPVVAFGALALLFAVCYGIYLYLQIFHPEWLRGDFGSSTAITAGSPPPLPAPSSTYDAAPATSYPATTLPAGDPATGATGMSAPQNSQMPLPGFPSEPGSVSSAGPSTASTITSSRPAGAVPQAQQNAELASLMNLPSRQPAPAPAVPPPSRLSTLGNALVDGPAATAPVRPAAPAQQAMEPPTPRPTPSNQATAPRTAAPAAVQAAPRPRNAPPSKPSLAAAKPLGAGGPQTGANVIELRDQVVVNAAPAPQIEAVTVADAYRAWRAGRLDQAREIYRDVLSNEPKNVDALLGLAGIAQQQGSSQEALSYFGRALELEPRNSSAQAGIIAMTGQSEPAASEARLKQLIAREPSAFLHFTLGNLYARQSQWAQAQQSYFQAFSMNADNSDYAYNLAVSLEHIGQDKLAVTYYRKAVDLSLKQGGRSSFNQEQVIDRIAKLSMRAR